eukprot:scaffold993_cov110-Cylindrotheca_fusiformis.AAC.16
MSLSLFWECDEEESDDQSVDTDLTFDDVAQAGPPSRPLDFPAPTVSRCIHLELRAKDHRSGNIHRLRDVIMRSGVDRFGKSPNTAYLITKKMAKTTYGSLRLCIVLERKSRRKVNVREDRQDRQDTFDPDFVEWESTDTLVVMKISRWHKIHSMRGCHLEDPIKEIAAFQLLGNSHSHIQCVREALQDDHNLYTVMPYLHGGDLYGKLVDLDLPTNFTKGTEFYGFVETRARTWFGQLLQVRSKGYYCKTLFQMTYSCVFWGKALLHLQKKGVCHRDISLENIVLDENDRLVLIDPGMSLRVPYSDPNNYGSVTNASSGGCRLLMIAQGHGGKLMYAPPEVINKEAVVDAFALDLWAAGIVLFVMIVGAAPFKWAHATDQRFSKISKGGLKELMELLEISISPEGCDLLQGFFFSDPRKRLTLAEVIAHPWVQGYQFVNHVIDTSPVTKKKLTYQSPRTSPRRLMRKKLTFSLHDHEKSNESPLSSPRRIGSKKKPHRQDRFSRRGPLETHAL